MQETTKARLRTVARYVGKGAVKLGRWLGPVLIAALINGLKDMGNYGAPPRGGSSRTPWTHGPTGGTRGYGTRSDDRHK